MQCSKVKRLLNRYIDKEIEDRGLIAQVEEHLNMCAHCQAQLKTLASVKGLIAQKEKITAQGDFLARLKEKLEPGAQIIRLRWLPQAGELARRLIPVPVVTMAIMFVLLLSRLNGLNPVEDYIYADLSNEEIGILSGYVDNSDLLSILL